MREPVSLGECVFVRMRYSLLYCGLLSKAPIQWGPGIRTPQKFGCGVLYVTDPHENFTEINLIKMDTSSGLVSLENVLNRQVVGASLRTPPWEFRALLHLLAGGEGNIPSPRTQPIWAIQASLCSVQASHRLYSV